MSKSRGSGKAEMRPDHDLQHCHLRRLPPGDDKGALSVHEAAQSGHQHCACLTPASRHFRTFDVFASRSQRQAATSRPRERPSSSRLPHTVYAWFTAGLDTRDLVDEKELLDQLR